MTRHTSRIKNNSELDALCMLLKISQIFRPKIPPSVTFKADISASVVASETFEA